LYLPARHLLHFISTRCILHSTLFSELTVFQIAAANFIASKKQSGFLGGIFSNNSLLGAAKDGNLDMIAAHAANGADLNHRELNGCVEQLMCKYFSLLLLCHSASSQYDASHCRGICWKASRVRDALVVASGCEQALFIL
jgi:hypothetical protein